jgi:2-polyprenyl-3-methyl-5-hydroxy-6-metoxy-1,4-benzoquinol methylase
MDNQSAPVTRLRASPSFALTFTMDGRPFVAKETEPYSQFWLNERDRIVLSMFSTHRGATTDDAIAGYLRLTGVDGTAAEYKRLHKSIGEMQGAGVLISAQEDVSRYSARIVNDYVAHRPFPRKLSDLIIKDGAVDKTSRILDLAGGPGDLSLALARVSDEVTLMDLSKGFVNAAAKRARQHGLRLKTLHDSCNRVIFIDGEYELVTVSQALHWLDDVLVCRGLCRLLVPGGSFFVIQGAFRVDDKHPLSYIFGDRSILGHRPKASFAVQVQALQKRLALLFDALDAPDVHRIDPGQRRDLSNDSSPSRITPVKVSMFHQRRPFGLSFARAFLTPAHIAVTRQPLEQFWADLENRCADATPEQMEGSYDWAVLQFKRGGQSSVLHSLDALVPTEIGYKAGRMM